MTENEISKVVVDAAFQVHTKLGPGLLESVYEVILAHELERRSMKVVRQIPVPISYAGLKFDEGFRAGMIVEDKVIVELKSIEAVLPVYKKQSTTYLKLTGLKLGLLINFSSALIKDGIFRVVNGLDE